MKTPEEIKKGMECCMGVAGCCACPYKKESSDVGKSCVETSTKDALAYIQQLEVGNRLLQAYNKGLLEKIGRLERELDEARQERDAAASDLEVNKRCETCKHYSPGYFCPGCRRGDKWQWRGVQGVE